MIHTSSCQLGSETLILETGRMARQAHGAVYAKLGGTTVLATVCREDQPKPDLDFVPLTIEYNEKYYASGRIPGGFLKREARPKDREILVSRIIDRPMRPLFYKEFGREIQVVPTCLSYDDVNQPDILGLIASSAAVCLSDIPFNGPIAGVRVCFVKGQYLINPKNDQIKEASLEIVVAGNANGITMVEGHAKEASEEELLEAIEVAKKPISDICDIILQLQNLAGKAKLELPTESIQLTRSEDIQKFARLHISSALFYKTKQERHDALQEAIQKVKTEFADILIDGTQEKLFENLCNDIQYDLLRKAILQKNERVDGRKCDQIRPISCEIAVLPRAHGSALFTRGETQALGVTTLGTIFDEQIIDDIEGDKRDKFMLHYNFPPFSVGEVGRIGTGRREIGHGNLARRAIEAILPAKDVFPYTIRVVSDILESNGSSSMATVCAATLSLMQAGVPLVMPAAGIAMGLVSDGQNFAILSDILGDEDHLGDMDFKVAGTTRGITGFQMDIKIGGVSSEIMRQALSQAKTGRLHILDAMSQTLQKPKADISEFAPKILTTKIDSEKIGAIIGPGGKNIKALCEQFAVQINVDDDGKVIIYGKNTKSASDARDAINAIVQDPIAGTIYTGTVKRIMDFGAFIEILPGKEGLCHISRLSKNRVESVSDILKEGDKIQVKLLEVDRLGRLNLASVEALDEQGNLPGNTSSENSQRPPIKPRFPRRDEKEQGQYHERARRGFPPTHRGERY